MTETDYLQLRKQFAESPYPMWLTSASLFAFGLRSWKQPLGYPGFGFMSIFSLIYAGAGYNLLHDKQYGTSTATCWLLGYPLYFAKRAIVSKKPGPISLVMLCLGGVGIYGPEAYKVHFG